MTEQYLKIFPILILILMLIIGLALLLRRYAPSLTRSTAQLRVLGSLPLGGKERVVLIQAGNDYLLLGVSTGQVQMLHQMDKEQVPAEGLAETPAGASGFAGILQNFSRKY